MRWRGIFTAETFRHCSMRRVAGVCWGACNPRHQQLHAAPTRVWITHACAAKIQHDKTPRGPRHGMRSHSTHHTSQDVQQSGRFARAVAASCCKHSASPRMHAWCGLKAHASPRRQLAGPCASCSHNVQTHTKHARARTQNTPLQQPASAHNPMLLGAVQQPKLGASCHLPEG